MTEEEWLTSTEPKLMVEYLKGQPTIEMREVVGHPISLTVFKASLTSERKARLFGVACCQYFSGIYDEPHCQQLINYAIRADVFEGRELVIPSADCCQRAICLLEKIAEEDMSDDESRLLIEALDALDQIGGDYAASHDSTDDYKHLLVATSSAASAIKNACSGFPIRPNVFGVNSGGALESLHGVIWKTAQAAAFRKGLAFVQSVSGGDPENRLINAGFLRDIIGNPFRPVTLDPRWQTETVVALATGIYTERAFDRMPILADALEDAGCDNADILNHCRGDGPHVRGCWVVDLILGKE